MEGAESKHEQLRACDGRQRQLEYLPSSGATACCSAIFFFIHWIDKTVGRYHTLSFTAILVLFVKSISCKYNTSQTENELHASPPLSVFVST